MKPPKRATYHLEVCPGTNLQGPTDEEIREALLTLPDGVPSWAVLTKKKTHFMQVGGSAHEGFSLEYQEFSVDGHWMHESSPDVDLETVTRAFIAFVNDDDETWRNLPWKRVSHVELQKQSAEAEKDLVESWENGEGGPIGGGTFWGGVRSLAGAALVVALEEMGLKDKPKKRRRQ